jgi:Flp pilus assembly pilin Flp
MQPSHSRRRGQRGASVIEYALLLALLSIALITSFPGVTAGVCEVGNRVGMLLDGVAHTCPTPASSPGSGSGSGSGSGNGSGTGNGNGSGSGNGNGNGSGNGNGKGNGNGGAG